MKINKFYLDLFTLLFGLVIFFTLSYQIYIFSIEKKDRFEADFFSGVHLSIFRDDKKFSTTFAHSGIVEQAIHTIGRPQKNSDISDLGLGFFRRPILPLETTFFSHYDLKKNAAPLKVSIFPFSDRFYLNGIQNFTTLNTPGISLKKNKWLIGSEITLFGENKKIIGVGENQIYVEGLFRGDLPNYATVKLNELSSYKKHLSVNAFSDTLFWQNGIWVYDNKARIFSNRSIVKAGDWLLFENGAKRKVEFVQSNGVLELEGNKLDPNLHGLGTKITVIEGPKIKPKKHIIHFSSITNDSFVKGFGRYQRLLVPKSDSNYLAKHGYVMFDDGLLHKIVNAGNGYVDVDVDLSGSEGKGEDIKGEVNKYSAVLPRNSEAYFQGIKFLFIPESSLVSNSNNLKKAYKYLEFLSPTTEVKTSPVIWATYTGLLNVMYDTVHPINKDYIIHVLGSKERKKYVDDFSRVQPQFVQTSVNNFDNSNFHFWTLNSSWDFYKQVISNYSPLFTDDYMILWKRQAAPWKDFGKSDVAYSSNNLPFSINSRQLSNECNFQLYTVTLNYEVINPAKFIPVIGKTDRYLINKTGAVNQLPVSIPPAEKNWSFPLLIKSGSPVTISLEEVHPLMNVSKIKISSIKLELIKVSQEHIRKMFFPTYYSDNVICN